LILPPKLALAVVDGRKTTITRQAGSFKPRVGNVYPIQHVIIERDEWSEKEKPYRETLCHVKVIGVGEYDVSEATDKLAEQEGFVDAEEMLAWWAETFAPVEGFTPVKVAYVEIDRRRFLVDSARARGATGSYRGVPSDPSGYVHSSGGAMKGEPEPVDPDTQARLTEEAHLADAERFEARRARREMDALSEQLAWIEQQQRMIKTVDLSSDMRAVKQRIAAMQRKLGIRRAA
jgi:hypothetical protein